MKKVFLFTLFLVLLLAGCQSSQRERNDETIGKQPAASEERPAAENLGQIEATEGSLTGPKDDPTLEVDPAPYISDRMDDFLQAWANAQTGGAPAHESNALDDATDSNRIMVPVLHMEGYEFWGVTATEYYYSYFFAPVGTTNPWNVSHETSFEVFVSKKVEFETSIEKRGLEAVNGMAYDSEDNVWFIDNSGKVIKIFSPDGIVLEDAEQLAECFTFETYAISENDELMKVEDTGHKLINDFAGLYPGGCG